MEWEKIGTTRFHTCLPAGRDFHEKKQRTEEFNRDCKRLKETTEYKKIIYD
ncbi:MAG: hypothetical protein WC614_00270 [bacterium]